MIAHWFLHRSLGRPTSPSSSRKGGPHVTTPLATHTFPAFLGLGSAPGARKRAGQDSLGARPVPTLPRQPVQHDDVSPSPPGPSRRPALCVPGHGLRQQSNEAVAHEVPSFGSLRRPHPPAGEGSSPLASRPFPPRPLSGAYPLAGAGPPGEAPRGRAQGRRLEPGTKYVPGTKASPRSPHAPQSPRNQQSPRIPLLGPPVRRAQVGNLGEEGLTLSRS